MANVPVIHDAQTIIYRTMPLRPKNRRAGEQESRRLSLFHLFTYLSSPVLYMRWRAASSARVICISHAIRDAMARAGLPTHNTEVIYSGVDPGIRGKANGPRAREELDLVGRDVVGIASRLSPEKGQEIFLRAAAALKDRFPNARFLIAGGPIYAPRDYEAHLKQLALSLGLVGRVVFTGFRKDALDVIDATDVMVCAADEEALGRVVLEAMALAKPVIATRAGGPCETVEDGVTGLLVPPRDFASLAEAIAKLLSDMDVARCMGKLGEQRAARLYTLSQNIQKVQELYRRILSERAQERRK